MADRVFITGIGLISAIGNNVDEALLSLEHRKSGLGEITIFDTKNKGTIPVCEVKCSQKTLNEMAEPVLGGNNSRTSLLGLIAAREAFDHAGLGKHSKGTTGLVSATSVGGMDKSENFYPLFLENQGKGRLRDVVEHECGNSTEFIAEHLGIRDYITTVSTACSSSANAIMFGARLIRNQIVDRVVAGGCDALTRFTLNGFFSLGILDKEGNKPFDDQRAGLNLGEGAGYLVLESETAVRNDNKETVCELTGFANTCDAFHQTASSPEGEGSYRAMAAALAKAGIRPEDVDYINAHGTGTPNNDLSEGKAIQRLFERSNPVFGSTKPYTGHTLGASGGIEAVLACLSIRDGLVYPNLRWQTPMKELSITPNCQFLKAQNIRNVVSSSFGFGGNDTSLLFSKC